MDDEKRAEQGMAVRRAVLGNAHVDQAMARTTAEAIAALDLRPQLPSVTAPALILSGAQDPAAPPSIGAYTARHIPGARFTVVQDASHFAHYEKPGPVTDALLSHFMSTVSAG